MYSYKCKGVNKEQSNHFVESLQPRAKDPVSFDLNGETLSCFCDDKWEFVKRLKLETINFRLTEPESETETYKHNKYVLKKIIFYCLFLFRGVTIDTIMNRFWLLKKCVILCNNHEIKVDSLYRYPLVIKEYHKLYDKGSKHLKGTTIFKLLQYHSKNTNLIILNKLQISELDKLLKINVEMSQTPYIPNRIHDYIIDFSMTEIKEFLKIFPSLKKIVKKAMKETEAIEKNKLVKLAAVQTKSIRENCKPNSTLYNYLKIRDYKIGLRAVKFILTNIRQHCAILIANYSLARKSEILSLSINCLKKESFEGVGMVYLIEGTTTKTQNNVNALWVISPLLLSTIDCLEKIHDLMFIQESKTKEFTNLFKSAKYYNYNNVAQIKTLAGREPLMSICGTVSTNLKNLYDQTLMKITQADFDEAIRITPTIDRDRFKVGIVWNLALHQLRRTQIVRATAFGVSLPALSYQAKHKTPIMTQMYGIGFNKLLVMDPESEVLKKIDHSIINEIVEAHVNSYNEARKLIKEDNSFFSEFGAKHKDLLFESAPLITNKDKHKGLQAGVIKTTLLGICMSPKPCDHASSSTVTGCMSKEKGSFCPHALINVDSLESIKLLIKNIKNELKIIPIQDTLKREALLSDIQYAEFALAKISNQNKKELNE